LRNKHELSALITEFPQTLSFRTFKAPGTLVLGKWKVKVHITMSHMFISQLQAVSAPDALLSEVVFNPPDRKEVRVPLRVFDFIVHTPGTRIKICEDMGPGRDGTVERLREDGLYRIRMDGESQSMMFDPERHNHTPAAIYRYGAGQKLLVHQRVSDWNSWFEAVVVQPLSEGSRHEVEFVKDHRRKKQKASIDLNSGNHMPAWVSAQEYERLQKHYTQYLSTRYSFIVDVITGRHLDVFTQFVHLRIVAGAAEGVTAWNHLVASVSQSPRRYDGIHPNPCSIILGGPASGKTSFARQLVMLCIRTNNDFMPIFVAVIDLARKMRHYKFRGDLIHEYLKVTHGENTQRYIMLRQALYSRCALIIADGIDEAGAMKPRIEKYLVRLARGGQRVICTSRAEGYTPTLYPQGLFVTLELMPLQRIQQNWLAENRLGKEKAAQFLDQLDAYEDIAGNPLMYQMLLCYTENYGVSSKAREALEIYTGVITIMLNRVEIGKGLQHGPDEVEKLLQIIALAAHCKRVRDFTDQDVVQLLHQKGSSISSKLLSTWEHIRSAIIEDRMPIVAHFMDSDVMYFRFSHLSFQEYFAACHAQLCRQQHQPTPLPAPEEIVFDGFWRKFLLFFFNQGSLAVTLSFPSGQLSYEKVQILAMFLGQAKAIVKVHLGANLSGHDGPMGAKDLSMALRGNATLRHLDLEANCIGADGASALAHALKSNGALQLLNLRNNSIRDGGASELAEALKVNDTLLNLNLRYNEIGPDGAKKLGEALDINGGLIVLNLEANDVGAEGAKHLAEALRNNDTIQELRLRNNRIGTEGAQFLSSALKSNKSLQLLDLETNRIGDGGAQSIAHAMQSHNQLQHLNLRGNTIGREGSKHLSKMLSKNRSLKRLDLQDNDLGAKQCMKLKKQWGNLQSKSQLNKDGPAPWNFSSSMRTIDMLLQH
jgi:Ran GTPase-activating protein (RanGAP) involved in mRNA processing and transport